MKYYNYKDLGITSSKKPVNTHLLIEASNGNLYLVDSTDDTELYKSTDKGENWTQPNGSWSRSRCVYNFWYDRDNSKLYFVEGSDASAWAYAYYIDLTDDSVNAFGSVDAGVGASKLVWGDIYYHDDGGSNQRFYLSIIARGTIVRWKTYYYNAGWILVADYNVPSDDVDSEWKSTPFFPINDTDNAFFIDYKYNDVTGVEELEVYYVDIINGGYYSVEVLYSGSTHVKDLPPLSMRGIAYDDDDILYFIVNWNRATSNYKLYSYSILGSSATSLGDHDVALMLDRNTDSTANPPNNLEKGFHLTKDRIYQIPANYTGRLNLISKFNFTDTIIAITDNFVMDNSGNVYEYVDLFAYILEGIIYHSRNDYPTLKLKFNSDEVTIGTQQFVQIVGSYTADGSTTENQVIFEGIAEAPTEGRIQYVLIKNQGYEMDETKPDGSKAGRSDEIITDINNDGSPAGPEYIKDGTLSAGGAMGTLVFNKSKTYRKVVNDFGEHDGFLWNLRPQGALDYNDGSVDSGADLRYDGSGNLDTILQVFAWKVAPLNQIVVNGAIKATGGLYKGIWNDTEDQQDVGINSITIEDASLNSDALCQAKADTMGAGETERTRVRFKFWKTTYGLIQPGQTITFKYDVTNYITVAEAQYILDKIILNIKTGVGYAEVSSGL